MPVVTGAHVSNARDLPGRAGSTPAPRDPSDAARPPDGVAGEWQIEPRLVGRRIGGRYALQRLHASGGMAWLYEAVDEQLGRVVAVKLLRPEFGRDATFAARFRQEAHSAASLAHPNVVTVHDYGEDPDTGLPFIVMELIRGKDLAARLAETGPLPADLAAEIAKRVALALGAAHEREIVHRDVKPGNILLGDDGTVKVVDFGIARALSETSLTLTGTALGSVHYVSPEQASGEPVSPASDLYSLGVVLFEMLTGRRPFDGDSAMGIAVSRLRERPPHPRSIDPDVPRELDAIVMRALERQPRRRYASAGEMVTALQRFQQRHEAAAAVAGAATPAEPPVLGTVYGRVETPANGHARRRAPLVPPVAALGAAAAGAGAAAGRAPGGATSAPVGPAAPARPLETLPPDAAQRRRRRDRVSWVPIGALAVAGLLLLALAGFGGLVGGGVLGALTATPRSDEGGLPVSSPSAATPPLTGAGSSATPSPTPTPDPSPTPTAEPSPTPTVAPTEAPTAAPTPLPTAAPTAPPTPAPTARPATPPPAADNRPAQAVVTWYALVEEGRFDEAAALWTASMRERYPPDEYIDGRFADTTYITVNSARTTAYDADQGSATVAVSLTEGRTNGDVRQWVGDWDLVLTSGGWRLNDPDF